MTVTELTGSETNVIGKAGGDNDQLLNPRPVAVMPAARLTCDSTLQLTYFDTRLTSDYERGSTADFSA